MRWLDRLRCETESTEIPAVQSRVRRQGTKYKVQGDMQSSAVHGETGYDGDDRNAMEHLVLVAPFLHPTLDALPGLTPVTSSNCFKSFC